LTLLCGCSSITDISMIEIGSNCTRLSALYISSCNSITNDAKNEIKRLILNIYINDEM